MKLVDKILAMLSCFFWGSNYVASKFILIQLPPITMTALRFTIMASILLILRIHLQKLNFSIFWLSLTQYVGNFCLLAIALTMISSGDASVLSYLCVPFSLFLGWFFFKEKLHYLMFIGTAIAILGCGMTMSTISFSLYLFPTFAVITSAFLYAFAGVLIKKIDSCDTSSLTATAILIAAPITWVISFLYEPIDFQVFSQVSWITWSVILYGCSSALAAFFIWNKLINKYPLKVISPYTLFIAIYCIILDWLILNETLSVKKIAGATLVLIGIFLIQKSVLIKRLFKSRRLILNGQNITQEK